MQMKYSAAPQMNHQDYGGRGYYGGQNNDRGRGGRGNQLRGNWIGGPGVRGSSDITHDCWKHGMYAHTGTEWKTHVEGHNKNTIFCNNIPGSERNCTWQVGSVPAINSNAV